MATHCCYGRFFPRDTTQMPTYTRKATEGRQIKVVIFIKDQLGKTSYSFLDFWSYIQDYE